MEQFLTYAKTRFDYIFLDTPPWEFFFGTKWYPVSDPPTFGIMPFFVATLFQPQLSSRPGQPHPVVAGFLRASAGRA